MNEELRKVIEPLRKQVNENLAREHVNLVFGRGQLGRIFQAVVHEMQGSDPEKLVAAAAQLADITADTSTLAATLAELHPEESRFGHLARSHAIVFNACAAIAAAVEVDRIDPALAEFESNADPNESGPGDGAVS